MILSAAAIAIAGALAMPSPGPQIQRHVLSLDDGSGLRYAIAIPDDYDGSEAVPLVLALHFGWGEALPSNYGAVFMQVLIEPAFRELGAIIVAPNCPARNWVDPRSETAVMTLMDHVRAEYRVDPDRIVVTGFSLGGFGTWYFASRHSEIFSAAVPMASVPVIAAEPWPAPATPERYAGQGSVEWPAGMVSLPMYVLHSRDDNLIPIGPVEAAAAELLALGAEIEFTAIDAGIGHHETPSYVPYLRDVVAWLQGVWAGGR